jgi:predicted membrane channel-forming protein YqfA (hemolysin III family)
MIGDVLRLVVVWVFAIVGIVIVILGIVKSETRKLELTNLVLTIFLIILSINYTIEFLRKLK